MGKTYTGTGYLRERPIAVNIAVNIVVNSDLLTGAIARNAGLKS